MLALRRNVVDRLSMRLWETIDAIDADDDLEIPEIVEALMRALATIVAAAPEAKAAVEAIANRMEGPQCRRH
jgi:hypothetical protein